MNRKIWNICVVIHVLIIISAIIAAIIYSPPLLAIVVIYGFFVSAGLAEWERNALTKHERCLKNISKLELTLLPDLPEELRWVDGSEEIIRDPFDHFVY